MQRVSAFLPSWDKRTSSNTTATADAGTNTNQANHTARTASAGGSFFGWSNRSSTASNSTRASVFNNLSKINVNQANRRVSKTGSLVNGNGPGSARVQREAFWPAPLDHECEKAARIIKSFCGMFSRSTQAFES